MKKTVKVSVIMSTHNTKEEFLNLAINSILNQSFKDFEFIIVNDGGNDLTFLKKIKDSRIVIINHVEKLGLPFSLNEAIKESRGKYIARMDSDDISSFDRLETQFNFMENNPDIGLCSMFYKKIDNEDEYIFDIWDSPEDIKVQLFYVNVIAHPSVMFRKEFLLKNNLNYSLDFPCSQDFELWTRCGKVGKIAIIPKLGLYYRMHNNQISTSRKEQQTKLYERVLLRNLEELDMDFNDLKYIKMLNGRINKIDFFGLSDFIDRVIIKNKDKKIYNDVSLKKVLNNQFFILALKNKFFNIKILCKRKAYSYINFIYFIKKIKYTYMMKRFDNQNR